MGQCIAYIRLQWSQSKATHWRNEEKLNSLTFYGLFQPDSNAQSKFQIRRSSQKRVHKSNNFFPHENKVVERVQNTTVIQL